MAQSKVRNLGERLVEALKERAASQGRSTDEDNRQISQAALQSQRLADHLASIPDVGDDEDFGRQYERPRPVGDQ